MPPSEQDETMPLKAKKLAVARVGCPTYIGALKGAGAHPDVDPLNVFKN
jgi:hypothetical protein